MAKKCNAVFEGGGVRGIGFAGAITAMEDAGYEFAEVVGSSAGAIAAALIAAGYSGKEIREELNRVNYAKFREKGRLGESFNLIKNYGMYKTNYFESWLKSLLEKKGKKVFGDLDGRLQVTASDLSERKILTLPKDLKQFGISPDGFSISSAVRMSMSIPFYFEAYKLIDTDGGRHILADGGLLSNYPIWILDDGTSIPRIPTFGFKFSDDGETDGFGKSLEIHNIIDYSKAVISTLITASDNYHISVSKGDLQRSILISVGVTDRHNKGVSKYITATEFDITREESDMLYANGYHAAIDFLKTWNFDAWKAAYRYRQRER